MEGRRYIYPRWTRVTALLPLTFILWIFFLAALERTPPMPIIVFAILIGCYSIWAACWLLRGAITVDEGGIGFRAWGQETFLAWPQVERIEYRNSQGQVGRSASTISCRVTANCAIPSRLERRSGRGLVFNSHSSCARHC